MINYLPRVTDNELALRLSVIGAVLIEGPKACGKTFTASRTAKTIVRMDEDTTAQGLVSLDPDALFTGETPILFDEWQTEPAIWNMIRRQVDDRSATGQFILTGSATPRDDVRRHSGAGRFGIIRMRPMSLFETGHSNGRVSLAALMKGEPQRGSGHDLSFREIIERIVIGGWPSLVNEDENTARNWLNEYLKQIVEVDVPAMGHRRNPRNLERLLMALARNVGQVARASNLAKDVGGESGSVAQETLSGYLDALDRLKLTDNSESWRPHMRSRSRLRIAPVRYFVDPSLGLAALNVGSYELMMDLSAAGFHFEALAVRDLRIYAQLIDGTVGSWRDANGREVDAIVSLRGGKWGAFEIKLSSSAVDEAAASLLRFAADVDISQHGEPAVLGVITSSGHAGQRPDGVHVIPITTLGP